MWHGFFFLGIVALSVLGPFLQRRHRAAVSTRLGQLSGLAAMVGRGHITLRWDADPAAIWYQVFRADSRNQFAPLSSSGRRLTGLARAFLDFYLPGLALDVVAAPFFVDTAVERDRVYRYRVVAWDGTNPGNPSRPIEVKAGWEESTSDRIELTVDGTRPAGPLHHAWEELINSAELVGWRDKVCGLHDELGMKRMRVHGIFCDDLGVCREGPGGIEYNWSGVDAVLDGIRANGFAPWIMLSYMPRALAANPRQKLHSRFFSSPPRDYAQWADLVRALTVHLIERYGRDEVLSWYFEVWNEPDLHLRMADYWHGTLEDYFRLYDAAADALKSVHPGLRVGGPGAGTLPTIEAFLRHVTQWSRHRSLDFLSMHLYGSGLVDLRPLLKRYGLEHVKVHYTEWGISGRKDDPIHDLPYAAAWIARVLIESRGQMEVAGYWTGEDAIEGQPQKAPFAGGYGLAAGHGLHKPAFWSFALLHRLGQDQLAVEGSGDGFGGCVHGLAACRGRDSIQILVSNATYDQGKARGSAELRRHVDVRVKGLARGAWRIRHFRADAAHSNVFGWWERAGRPGRPSEAELAALRACDRLEPYEADFEAEPDAAGGLRLSFELPMPAVSLIEIERTVGQAQPDATL